MGKDYQNGRPNQRGGARAAGWRFIGAAFYPIGAEAFPSDYSRALGIAAILCFLAVIVLLVPMLFDYWRRWRHARQMDSNMRLDNMILSSPAASRRVEELGKTESVVQDALGWTDEEDASGLQDESGVEPGAVLGRGETILIADDDPVLVLALSHRLQDLGYTVLRSSDAIHALMGAVKAHPDLVILDIKMPSGNGLAVCEMMASDPQYANIPVIIHSIVADEATKQRCQQLNAHYVEKSQHSWSEIRSLVERLLPADEAARPRSSTGGRPATERKAGSPRPKESLKTLEPAAPAAALTQPEPQQATVSATPPVCGRSRVLCIESPKDCLELVDHQLSGLGMEVLRTSNLEEGFWMCFTEKPHVVVVQAKATEEKLRSLLSSLTTHPITRDLPVLWINEDNAVADVPLPSSDNLKVLKYPIDWEDMLGELEKLLPMFGQQWSDPLKKIAKPTPEAGVEDRQTTEAGDQSTGAIAAEQPLRILCIDDDPLVARSIAIRLQPYGIEVKEAGTGMQGYLLAVSEQPDLILLDLKMPNGEGNYIISKLKDNDRTKNIPVVILTVQSSAGVRRHMFSLGADGFMSKPAHWPELFTEIGRCVRLPKQLLIDYGLKEQLTVQEL